MRGIPPRGGTVLGSSRTNPLREENGVRRIKVDPALYEEVGVFFGQAPAGRAVTGGLFDRAVVVAVRAVPRAPGGRCRGRWAF